jgi:hypothetical protein
MEEEMKDDSRIRDARMMNAVAGMGGRSVLSSEVDLRLGFTPDLGSAPVWLDGLIRRIWGRRKPGHTDTGAGQSESKLQHRMPFRFFGLPR